MLIAWVKELRKQNESTSGKKIEDTISSFEINSLSPHEHLSRAEFVLRLTLAFALPGALKSPEFQLAIPGTPGLGAISEALTSVVRSAPHPLQDIAQSAQDFLLTPLPVSNSSLNKIVPLRNHLAHGNACPVESTPGAIANTISQAIQKLSYSLTQILANAYLEFHPIPGKPSQVNLQQGADYFELSPLIAHNSISDALLVFSRIDRNNVVLNAAQYESTHRIPRSDYDPILKRIFRTKSDDSFLADFTHAALDDLVGFQEPGTSLYHSYDDDFLFLNWTHADGSNVVPRTDRLRVGPDNAWQWHDGINWKGYSEFLRQLAKWPTLRARLSKLLEEKIAQTQSAENTFVPVPKDLTIPFISTKIQLAQPGSEKKEFTFEEFTDRLDADVQARGVATNLYFIHAEAGAGKTTALLDISKKRANNRELSDKPLFLYVSARGNVLEDLDRAVDATVAETRILTSASVKALCRNGLIMLIVDGFDELVGSPTYSDALASLRPWLKELGGRGVLIVSARSSYYLALFENSIRLETNRDINVRYYIAELDRWTPTQRDCYLNACGVSNQQIQRLPDAERELLCLPFFARASINSLRTKELFGQQGLLGELIHGYLEREQGKLAGPSTTGLVSTDELQRLFEELAAWMVTQNTREVSWADLLLITEISLSSSITDELKNRLVALCGLDIKGGQDFRFRFSHETFLDYFLGCHIGQQLAQGSSGALTQVFSTWQLQPGVVRVAMRRSSPQLVTLVNLTKNLSKEEGLAQSLLASNAGLIWAEMLGTKKMLVNEVISRVAFASLDLQSVDLSEVKFDKCEFDLLHIGGGNYNQAVFDGCIIRQLRLKALCSGVSFKNCTIDTATTKTIYAEQEDEIVNAIQSVGGIAIVPPQPKGVGNQDMINTARFYLNKLNLRPGQSIVLSSEWLPDNDPGLNWINRHFTYWDSFLDALISTGLVQLDPIDAAGQPKFRVRWETLPNQILQQNEDEDNIRMFWDKMAKVEL